MPNHFHFEILANEKSCEIINRKPVATNVLTEAFKLLLMSYTKALQKQRNFTGSLFQPKTKCSSVDDKPGYAVNAFHYIHQNALKAGLVKKMEDWEFSSFADYAGFRQGTLCNTALGKKLFSLDPKNFYDHSYDQISDEWRNEFEKKL